MERPYHPNYTHMVFRGWYDFGAGTMADMGHYSLWTVFKTLQLEGPTSVEPMFSHDCMLKYGVSTTIKNDFSFPTASVVRLRYPAKGQRAAVDVIWYDGGMRPPTPEEMDEDHKEFSAEQMMFVGDKGKILAGFYVDNPRLIPERRMRPYNIPEQPPLRQQREQGLSPGLKAWAAACRGGKQPPGRYLNAWPISEAVNLWAVALRTRQRVMYDAATMTITNVADANRYLSRE